MIELLGFIRTLLHIYWWIIIASAIMSWLLGFGIVNYTNPQVRQIWRGLGAVTEPALAPIRRFLPAAAGLDFSPLVLLVAIHGLADFLIPYLMRTIG